MYSSFQDDLPKLKGPQKPSTIYDFVSNPSSRCFQDVWGLVLVFILIELPIGVMQTIPFFALVNQNYCQYI